MLATRASDRVRECSAEIGWDTESIVLHANIRTMGLSKFGNVGTRRLKDLGTGI